MADYTVKNADLIEAIKEVGEAQAAVDLVQGTKNRVYRKGRNMRVSAYQEIMKNDPRYKELEAKAKALVAAKLKSNSK